MPRHQFTAGRAQKKNRRCQDRRPRRERIPIRPHTSSSPSSRRESIRRNPTTRRRHAGCPTRRRATFSVRSKPPRATSSASACLAARCVLVHKMHPRDLFSRIPSLKSRQVARKTANKRSRCFRVLLFCFSLSGKFQFVKATWSKYSVKRYMIMIYEKMLFKLHSIRLLFGQ